MDSKEMRNFISKSVDISNSRLTDNDKNVLVSLIKNFDKYNGSKKTFFKTEKGFDQDGKYICKTKTTYQLLKDTAGIFIKKVVEEKYDDGDIFNSEEILRTARELLKHLHLFKDK